MNKLKTRASNFTKKALIIVILLLALTNSGLSQEKDFTFSCRNAIYLNFTTRGALYSINYDRIFYETDKIAYSYRLGFSVLEDVIAAPAGINLFVRKGNFHPELSLTLMPYVDKYKSFMSDNDLSDKYLYVIPGIGYRYQKPNGGFFAKALISPMVVLDPPSSNFWKMDPKLYPAASIGLGYSF